MKTLCACLVLVACGSARDQPQPANDAHLNEDAAIVVSGPRIKTKYLETTDGTKILQGVFDSLRNEDCWFAYVMSDGVMRCTPSIGTPTIYQNEFGDAACTIPVAIGSSCAPPKYVMSVTTTTGCQASTSIRLFVRGTTYTTSYSKNSAMACIANTTAPMAAFYAAGAEITPTSFQAAAMVVE